MSIKATSSSITLSRVDDGERGTDGASVTTVAIEYGTTTDKTTPPTDDQWQTDVPKWIEGDYIWIRSITTIISADGTITIDKGTPALYQALDDIAKIATDAANEAKKATQYVWHNDEGVHVSETPQTEGFTGANVVLDSGKLDFRDKTETVARFGSDGAEIGRLARTFESDQIMSEGTFSDVSKFVQPIETVNVDDVSAGVYDDDIAVRVQSNSSSSDVTWTLADFLDMCSITYDRDKIVTSLSISLHEVVGDNGHGTLKVFTKNHELALVEKSSTGSSDDLTLTVSIDTLLLSELGISIDDILVRIEHYAPSKLDFYWLFYDLKIGISSYTYTTEPMASFSKGGINLNREYGRATLAQQGLVFQGLSYDHTDMKLSEMSAPESWVNVRDMSVSVGSGGVVTLTTTPSDPETVGTKCWACCRLGDLYPNLKHVISGLGLTVSGCTETGAGSDISVAVVITDSSTAFGREDAQGNELPVTNWRMWMDVAVDGTASGICDPSSTLEPIDDLYIWFVVWRYDGATSTVTMTFDLNNSTLYYPTAVGGWVDSARYGDDEITLGYSQDDSDDAKFHYLAGHLFHAYAGNYATMNLCGSEGSVPGTQTTYSEGFSVTATEDEHFGMLADTGAAPSGVSYTSGTHFMSNDFRVQVRESDGTLSEAIRIYQNTSGGSTASFGYGTDSTVYYNLADSFAITSHTLFTSKSFTSKAAYTGSLTVTKAGWYPLGIVGESVNARYVTINRKYLESRNRSAGTATLQWMAENWDTSTHSATANVNVLWARG